MTFFAYRQYYPSLASPVSHLPFRPRIDKTEDEPGREDSRGPILPTAHTQSQDGTMEGTTVITHPGFPRGRTGERNEERYRDFSLDHTEDERGRKGGDASIELDRSGGTYSPITST